MSLIARCRLKQEVLDQWRQQTFMALKAAYRERVQEYNDYMAQKCAEKAQQADGNNDYRINPMMARAIEKRELKRLVLEFIFLQAGLSKMVVPVRAGYEKAVMFYLDTGIIVDSSAIVTDGEDGLYQSIDEALDMTEYDDEGHPIEPKPEAEWETRIPSSLVIIQDGSNPLKQDGLPCDCHPENIIGEAGKDGRNLLGVVEASDIG